MIRIIDNFRAIFISPEFLIIICLVGLYVNYPHGLTLLGEKIKLSEEFWKYLFSLPFIFTAIAIRQSSKIRAPLENVSNKNLYNWEFYHRVTDRIYIGILYSILSCIFVILIFIFDSVIDRKLLGAVFLGSICVSGIVALTMVFAPQKLKELLQKHE